MSVDIRLYSLILRASSEGYHDLVDRVLSRSAADHRPALLECRDDSGATPLYEDRRTLAVGDELVIDSTFRMKSARAGHHPTVQVLLRFGASVSATSQLGNTSMHWACLGGFKPIVKSLAEHDSAMLTCRNQNGDSPLMWACTRGHTECIRYIIDFAPKETQHKNDAGINALMCTTMSGHEEALSLLLEKGRDAIDHTDRNGNTVLHLAIIARQAPCVKVILAHNPNLHVNNHKALSPLDLIAQEECCEECKKVVDNHLFVLQQRSAMATTSLLSELSVNTDPPATSKRDDQSTVPDAVAPSASSGDVAVACAEVEKQNDSVLQFESDQSSDLCQFRMAKMEDQLKECVGESVAERLELLPEHLLGMGLDGLSASQLDMVAKIHREVGEKIEQSRHHIEHQMVVDMHIEMLELHAKLNKLSRNS